MKRLKVAVTVIAVALALCGIGLVLFVITVAINALSRLLVWRVGGERTAGAKRPLPATAA